MTRTDFIEKRKCIFKNLFYRYPVN